MVNGKQKGASFERDICKKLSLWLSNDQRQDLLWRSAMSGGRSTVALKAGAKLGAQAGDISSIDRLSHAFVETFMTECKAYRTLNFEGLIKGKGHLIDFWKIATREATKYGKHPLLIGKQNNHPIIVCMTYRGSNILGVTPNMYRLNVPPYNMRIILLDDFLTLSPLIMKRVRMRL